MRILSIRFANHNSLAGEWHIDFADKDFLTSGIFAITGPTGSGKSTILDALCLALYGSTPRLGKISKSSNDIMTRGTGKCFAEVVFSTVHGEFRCRWSQNRAREKAEGALQQATHVLWDSEGRALAEKLNDVAAKVKDITGMDFERFTQSTLLAQGGFAKFLLAKGPDRAPLLEEMTGTGIYSDISAHIFSRNKAEQEKLNELDKEISLCNVLSDEEEAELRAACDRLMQETAILVQKEKELNAGLHALRTLASLKTEREALLAQQSDMEKQIEEFRPDSIRLETAHRALRHSAACSALIERQKEQERDMAEARKLTESMIPLAKRVQEQEKDLAAAEQNLSEAKLAHANLLETLKSVRSLDVQIATKNQELQARNSACSETERKLALTERRLSEHESSLAKQRISLSEMRSWLDAHADDADLPQQISAMRILSDQLNRQDASLKARLSQIEEKREELEKACLLLEMRHQNHEAEVQELKAAESGLSELESRRIALLEDRTAAEWRWDKEELVRQDSRLQEMQDAAQRRSLLLKQEEQLALERLDLERKIEDEQALLASEQTRMDSLTQLKQELGDSLALLDRIQSYEEARLHLQDGEACPLCGSLHHPFAEGNMPTPGEKKLQLQKCEQDIRALNEALVLRRSSLAGLQYDSTHKSRISTEKREEAEALARRIEDEAALLSPALSGILLPKKSVPGELAATLEELRAQTQIRLAEISRIVEQNDSLQEQAGKLHDTISQLRTRSERSLREMRTLDQKKAALQAELIHLESEQDAELAQYESTFADMRRNAAAVRYPLQNKEGVPAMLDALSNRGDLFAKRQKDASSLSESCAELETACLLDKQDKSALENTRQSLAQEKESLDAFLSLLRKERRELFGELDADREEGKASARLKDSADRCELCRKNCDMARKEQNDCSARLAALEARLEERAALLAHDEDALLPELRKDGFDTMHICLEACLGDKERSALESAERSLAEGMASISSRLLDNESRLAQLEGVPDLSEAETVQKLEEVRQEQNSRQEELGARRERLTSSEQNRKEVLQKKKQRDAQEKVCRRWADLNELIGSADGKKFRNYAQELTFRVLIGHANRQLTAMTDRYLLVQDPEEALALAVIDRYQADAIRTSRNLSGGEIFLVSLSLALGLARMASRNVRVDSVFLDEGFGTLDEEALNMALDMLSSLREQGKTIGIISHVQTIRERIGTQIHVEPSGNGRSRLSGPGISRN